MNKIISLIIFIYTIIILAACNNNDYAKEVETSISLTQYWINYDYISCVDTNLPCECQNKIDYILLRIDNESNTLFAYEKSYDPEDFRLETLSQNNYDAYMFREDTIPFFNIKIQNDTLYIKDRNDEISNFCTYLYNKNNVNNDEYDKIIGKLNLHSILNSTGSKEKIIEKLNISDSTFLICTDYFGNLTFGDTCDKQYLFEKNDRYLFIYKDENSCDEAELFNRKIIKKLIDSFDVMSNAPKK